MQLEIEDHIAEELFELLQELINRAKENGETVVISYVAPLLVMYGKAYIAALDMPKSRKKLLSTKFVRKYSR